MAVNKITLDTGSTIHTGTYVITESALQVNIPRSTLNQSDGTEIGITTNPLYVITSGGTLGLITITGNTSVINTVAVTGSVTLAATPINVTGSTVVVSLPSITGSVTLANAVLTVTGNTVPISVVGTAGTDVINIQGNAAGIPVNVTGSTVIVSLPSVTGSVTVANAELVVTGNTVVINTVAITGSTTIANVTPISITGSTTIANASLTITGSTSVVNTVAITGSTTSYNPTTATISVLTTANTNVILIPSHATLGIRIKSVIISVNTGGTVAIAQTSTLTTGNLKIGTLHLAANGGMALDYSLPLECSATTNVVYTTGTATSTSITAQYYYA